MHVAPAYNALWKQLGLTSQSIFTDPRIDVWRDLPERQNATLDFQHELQSGRFHIKRYLQPGQAEPEARGIALLIENQIPTVPLVAWDVLPDGRGYVVSEDLYGYTAADKLIQEGVPFERLLEPTARLAARLHAAGLHHCDLYLCHFFAHVTIAEVKLALIDAGRVRRLPGRLMRWRWITKDLAQFRYSTYALPITDEQRERWLRNYADARDTNLWLLHRMIRQKTIAIARHDRRLRVRQPDRNVSIPRVER